jgi:N-acetylmuramic acid 6-phosphate etherase
MNLPPDRSHIATETRNPRTMDLHRLSVGDCVRLIQQEDRAVLAALETARPRLISFLEAAEPKFVRGGRLIYLGAGTSGRLGVLDASEAPPTFQIEPGRVIGIIAGGDSALRSSSEAREDDADGARAELSRLQLSDDDTVIGIAAGGTTPYVLGALGIAKEMAAGALTALMTCAEVAKPESADYLILLPTGPETLTGSTRLKAGTATKLALNTISTTLMVRLGKVYENLMVDVKATNAKLRDRAARIIATLTALDRPAAFALLERARGSVKTAIVMQRMHCDRLQAEQVLASAHGRLGLALGEESA